MATMEISDKHLHEEQRRRVIEMASAMFTEQGIRKVRMDDVATALGMSKRTLYEMFADKEELLLECVKRNQNKKREFADHVVETSNNVLEIVFRLYRNGMEELKKIHPSAYQDIKKYPKVYDFLRQRKAQKMENTRRFYEAGISQGLFRSDINIEIFQFITDTPMSRLMSDNSLMQQWPLAEVLDTVMRVNMRGICTEKGQHLLDEFFERETK